MDELDLQAHFARQSLGVLAQLIAERLGETRIVEYPHLALVQLGGHPSGVANLRQGAEDQHPVRAAQSAGNLSHIAFRQQFDVHPPS